ncbi:hypothetical protein ID866_6165 [Astraeus odoratus]|nr:hypothetical protein ID866_6165 [Astraeus odoratus]
MQLKFNDAQDAVLRGAIEGTIAGSGITFPAMYIMNRRWPYFRSLPPQLKALGAVVIILPMMTIRAEHKMIEFERSHWDDANKYAVERRAHEERLRRVDLGLKDRFGEWAARHKLGVVVGSWALAMTVAGAIIMPTYLCGTNGSLHTYLRQVVQARVWAQGLTLGVIIATGALTHSQRAKAAELRKVRIIQGLKSRK